MSVAIGVQPAAGTSAIAQAPGKINAFLGVGELQADGYHELVTVFQALDLWERVELHVDHAGHPQHVHALGAPIANRAGERDFGGISPVTHVRVHGPYGGANVPTDHTNLAVAAINALAAESGTAIPVSIDIEKNVPVAGGMGGGSADAAAALVAYARLAGIEDQSLLVKVGSSLGADIPFALHGGTAVGTGRGDVLSPVMVQGSSTWVLATSRDSLSTPLVYRTLDELRASGLAPVPSLDPAPVLQALAAGDPHALAASVHNDMTHAAINLLPDIAQVLRTGTQAGALAALLSGSGPTVGFLVKDATHALDLTVMLEASTSVKHVVRTSGPVPGAHIVG